jgi:hypothetical protein
MKITNPEFVGTGATLTAAEFLEVCIDERIVDDLLDSEHTTDKHILGRAIERLNIARRAVIFSDGLLWVVDLKGNPVLVPAKYEFLIREATSLLRAQERQAERLRGYIEQIFKDVSK